MEYLLSGAELDKLGEQIVEEYLGGREVQCLDVEDIILTFNRASGAANCLAG